MQASSSAEAHRAPDSTQHSTAQTPPKGSETSSRYASAIKALLALVGRLPIGIRSRLGSTLGALFSLIPTRDRAFALLQLRATSSAIAATSGKVMDPNRVLRGVYSNLGRNLLESLNLKPFLARSDQLFIERQSELITRLHDSKRPIVALTAHFGNWDLFAALMVKRGFSLMVIGREARNPILQDVLASLRDAYGVETLWRSEGPKALKEILGALKAGRTVGALIDQDTRVAGSFIPFFGIPAHTPATLIELAKRCNAHIVGSVLRRNGLGGEVIVQQFDPELSTEEILNQFHRFLESQIADAPEQWAWVHKRWRTLPSGERQSSGDYRNRLVELAKE